jgi:hypothetical protein
MNKTVMIFALIAGTCCAQQTAVQPDPAERPLKPFSNVVPEGTAWVVTIKKPWELTAGKAKTKDPEEEAYLAKFASSTVKSIHNAYASGIRREVIRYGDDSKFTRYVTKGMLLYEDRKTGEPVLEDPASSPTGPSWGVNRLGELSWVADKYYLGVSNYRGKACYVYRQFAPEVVVQQDINASSQEAPPGAAPTELKDPKNAKIVATAFIDKETMQPVAYETVYEVWLYEKGDAVRAFEVPSSLLDAARKQAEAVEKRQKKYQLRQ